MSWPQQVNPTQEVALAPYNFVPLPEKVVTFDANLLPDQCKYHSELHTGRIELTLTTETPLYVRCALTPSEYAQQEEQRKAAGKGNDNPAFFYTDPSKTPRIPGSSIRGMLRNLVEIISYSKVEAVTDEPLVYRAVGDTTSHGVGYRDRIMQQGVDNKHWTPKVRAGYMRGGGSDWHIQPAQVVNDTTFARIWLSDIPAGLSALPDGKGAKNARLIYFQPGPYEFQDVKGGFLKIKFSRVSRASKSAQPGLIAGALVYSGAITSKRSEAVIFPEDTSPAAKPIPVSDELVLAYRDQISPEQEDLLGGDGVLRDGQPVFYLVEKGRLVFFGHTMMMRLPYLQRPLDLVPIELRDRPSVRERRQSVDKPAARVDMGEALFGYTKDSGKGKERSYASRIFVGDAVMADNQADPWYTSEEGLTPHILGSPKPTTFQHYLVQTDPDQHQIGTTKDGRPRFEKRLVDYTAQIGKTQLRGHKLYWHKRSLNASDFQQLDEQKIRKAWRQYTRIRPVKAGVTFKGTIRFENLSDIELGALLWAVTIPGPAKDYRHKLGMAKPYGLGSVKVTASLHLDDRRKRYETLFDGQGWQESAPETPGQISTFITAFDGHIRQALGVENRFSSLTQLERIAMLLTMMEWPGPPNDQTRYLEIEHLDRTARRGKINEYKARPVLPDPLAVVGAKRDGLGRLDELSVPPVSARTPAPQPTQGETASDVAPLQQAPPETRQGVVVEIRPDLRRGRVRDVQTGREYPFEMKVIEGNTPGRRAEVQFDVLNGRVVKLRRA